MVPNNAQSHGIFPNFGAFYRASCGVVHFWAAVQPLLKGLGGFADIVGKPNKLSPASFTECRRKAAAKLCRPL